MYEAEDGCDERLENYGDASCKISLRFFFSFLFPILAYTFFFFAFM